MMELDEDNKKNDGKEEAELSEKACTHCRRIKQKCSRGLPGCARCVASERVCKYPAMQKPVLPVTSRVPSPEHKSAFDQLTRPDQKQTDDPGLERSCEICKLSNLPDMLMCCKECLTSHIASTANSPKSKDKQDEYVLELEANLFQERKKVQELKKLVEFLESQISMRLGSWSPVERPVILSGVKQKSHSKKPKGGAVSMSEVFTCDSQGSPKRESDAQESPKRERTGSPLTPLVNNTSRGRRTKRPAKFNDEFVDWGGSTDQKHYKKATNSSSAENGKRATQRLSISNVNINQRYILENVPFPGWRREMVYRSTGNKQADIYFHPPHGGKKLRSRPDILRYYINLGLDAQSFLKHFSFTNVWCTCQTRDYQSSEVIRCSLGAGGCNGYVHAKCVGLEKLTAVECAEMTTFTCELCKRFGEDIVPFLPLIIRETPLVPRPMENENHKKDTNAPSKNEDLIPVDSVEEENHLPFFV